MTAGDYKVFGRPLVGLSGITRFSRRLKARQENVAEHSFYVAFIAMQLCQEYKVGEVESALAIKYALCHDVPELILDDINHDVKRKYPQIKEILADEELRLLCELDGGTYGDLYHTHTSTEGSDGYVARLIVELADAHAVFLYIQAEGRLGNNYFMDINEDTQFRINNCKTKLQEALTYGGKTDA